MTPLGLFRTAFAAASLFLLLPTADAEEQISFAFHEIAEARPDDHASCTPCHVPASDGTPREVGALWVPEGIESRFEIYASPTMDATPSQPTGPSKLCLSCHDGTIAADATRAKTPRGFRSASLSDDHPISFTYDSELALEDGGLRDPATVDLPLFSGRLECSTCHDVHDTSQENMLRIGTNGSALCLECHVK